MRPLLRMLAEILRLPDRRPRNLLGELLKGPEVVIKGGMLPGGLETVGEGIERHRGVELVRCGRDSICEAGCHFPLSYLALIEEELRSTRGNGGAEAQRAEG